jgi:hypothetical protein
VFVGLITAMIAVATVVAMIPGIPVIDLLVGVQVVNGVLSRSTSSSSDGSRGAAS